MPILARGNLELALMPEAGGCIARFAAAHDGGVQQMLRPLPAGFATPDPLDMACYPLVPFSGRITNGRFAFAGRAVQLPPDDICPPHAIHGRGWQSSWEVIDADSGAARLRYRHDGGNRRWTWPWSFEAEQHFALDEAGLTVTMRLINRAAEAMPAGLGLHPFFEAPTTARLTAHLPRVWESDADGIPTGIAATPEKWRFDEPRAMRDVEVDHCFSGGDGNFRIDWEDRPFALRIEAADAPHAIVFAPPGEDFFCAEPVSHAPDAVNRPEPESVTGLVALAPGETMQLTCRFAVEPR
ncbi:MAG: aldose 1-epimerase [Alphaproteobacteria bacterium HGW-Alphaproteobacteria-11]|nr:MAG: aldose 1-epimerase [Alphaproteobacteria bacterium HGW-Alphaproteobacteria-11]